MPATPSLLCPAGVRGIEVPSSCAHGIEPHWSRRLLLKHHQWTALSRQHASRLVDGQVLRRARDLYEAWFLGEPVCSDELLPLLALSLPDEQPGVLVQNQGLFPDIEHIPLIQGAARGLASYEMALERMGATSSCITYAPWPGCRAGILTNNKRAKSPVVGGGLLSSERLELMRSLAELGVLFCRKLGMAGDKATEHIAHINAWHARSHQVRAPHRLLPVLEGVDLQHHWQLLAWLRFSRSTLEASVPVTNQVLLGVLAAATVGWASIRGGAVKLTTLKWLLAINAAGHCIEFILSVALFPEYSFLEPFHLAGVLSRAEM